MIEPNERAALAARQMLLARAMRIGWLGVSIDVARMRLALRQFNPEQPRVPAGQSGGGQWTGEGDTVAPTPAADSPAREVTTDASGATVETTRRPDGSIVATTHNPDGSAIRSEYAASRTAGYDERHVVMAADGASRSFETEGNVQTIRDGAGRVLSRTEWTPAGPEAQPVVQQAYLQPGVGAKTVELGLMLYGALAGRNVGGTQAVAAFNSREYSSSGNIADPQLSFVGRLTQQELDDLCERRGDVQAMTNEAAKYYRREHPDMSPQNFGTAVHAAVAREVGKSDPDFRAEFSLIKSEEAGYGQLGSIRIDVFERTKNDVVCVYDIKTGQSGLTSARIAEIAGNVASIYRTKRFTITEIRPE
ncbi:hypothetical protein E8L99_13065 [Phreatobacter aquaticus]|uniref:Uncharacterized protein n=1 Tax=Phreatobacter aquaticus TaxID=2570229 RepID=A0A4D7QFA8_9HYPH|nr:hypothetical protein [Phreatobacter aquaticus]QCK86620.1 hypothetical protein E8L99_13065 [Phreatobacter aquaticus]